jgi:ATP-dependent RNA helicase DDX5/DBP2
MYAVSDSIVYSFDNTSAHVLASLSLHSIAACSNFDFPNDIENYVHRIGRTARAGAKGTALSFFTMKSSRHTHELIKILRESGNDVPPELGSGSGGGFYGGRN